MGTDARIWKIMIPHSWIISSDDNNNNKKNKRVQTQELEEFRGIPSTLKKMLNTPMSVG